MKLYKIYNTIVPSMQDMPCKIAVFVGDDGELKVYQKEIWRSGRITPWERNYLLKSISDVERCVNYNNENPRYPVTC